MTKTALTNCDFKPLLERDNKALPISVFSIFIITAIIPLLSLALLQLCGVFFSRLASTAIGFSAILLLIKWRLKKTNSANLLHLEDPWGHVRFALFIGALLAVLGTTASLTEVYLIATLSPTFSKMVAEWFFFNPLLQASPFSLAVGCFIYCLLIPTVEEIFFRQYVLGNLLFRFRPPVAIGYSIAIFSALHFEMLAHGIYAFVLSLMTLTRRSLVPAIAAHIAINVLAFVIPAAFPRLRTGAGATVVASDYGPLFAIASIALILIILATMRRQAWLATTIRNLE
jgi:membrane protease YdiL (CAAX protease family)